VGERAVRVAQDAGVVGQAWVNAAGPAAAARIDRQARREGERSLLEPLGTEQLFPKRPVALPILDAPTMEKEQVSLPSKIGARAQP
jgi:hypothetical protein